MINRRNFINWMNLGMVASSVFGCSQTTNSSSNKDVSNTVSGNFQDELERRSVTPEMFEAVGDGITDDSEAIQAAINAMNSCGSGTVKFTQKYLLNSPLTAKSNVQLVGVGNAEIVNGKPDTIDVAELIASKTSSETLNRFVVEGLSFNGNVSNGDTNLRAGVGVKIWKPYDCHIRNCRFRDMGGPAVIYGSVELYPDTRTDEEIRYTDSYSSIQGCYIDRAGLNHVDEGGGKGIRLAGTDYVKVIYNNVTGATSQGIQAVECAHVNLEGNVLKNCTGGASWLSYGCALSTNSNNIAINCANTAIAALETADNNPTSRAESRGDRLLDFGCNVVSNNVIDGTDKSDAFREGITVGHRNTVVNGNTITRVGQGIRCNLKSINYPLENLTISNNNIQEIGQRGIRSILLEPVNVTNIKISDNQIRTCGDRGISFFSQQGSGYVVDGIVISDNTITDITGYAVDIVERNTNITVRGNLIRNGSANFGTGIRITDNGVGFSITADDLTDNSMRGGFSNNPFSTTNVTVLRPEPSP